MVNGAIYSIEVIMIGLPVFYNKDLENPTAAKLWANNISYFSVLYILDSFPFHYP